MDSRVLALGVLLPGLASGLILAGGWRLWSRERRSESAARAWVSSFAVASAACLGTVLQFGWPGIPRESWRWLAWGVPAFAGLDLAVERLRVAGWLKWSLRLVLIAVLLRGMLASRFSPTHKDPMEWGELLLHVLRLGIVWLVWEAAILPRSGARLGSVLLWLVASTVSALMLFSSTARLAQMGGSLSAGLGALVVGCALRPNASGAAGAVAVAIPALGCFAVNACQFARPVFVLEVYLLVVLAPLLGVVAEVLGWRPRSAVGRVGMRIGLTLAPLAVALYYGWREYGNAGEYE